ncbi:unnamed protein product, partial [Rhizoctonia solani]
GIVSDAVRYVERVPIGYGDVQWLKGAFEINLEVKPAVKAPSGPYGVPPAPAPNLYGVPAPLSGPYGAPAPSGPYGTTPAPGPYGTPPAQSAPFAPPATSTVKPATSYGTQGGYNPSPLPGQQTGYGTPAPPSYGQQPFQNQRPGFRAPMVQPPPSPMAPVPPPPTDHPSGPNHSRPPTTQPSRLERRTPAPAGAPAAAITRPFPNSPAPGSPVTSGPPRGSGTPPRAMSPSGGPPRGMSPQTGSPRAGTGPPPPMPHSGDTLLRCSMRRSSASARWIWARPGAGVVSLPTYPLATYNAGSSLRLTHVLMVVVVVDWDWD